VEHDAAARFQLGKQGHDKFMDWNSARFTDLRLRQGNPPVFNVDPIEMAS
jgi:hypothetical protein